MYIKKTFIFIFIFAAAAPFAFATETVTPTSTETATNTTTPTITVTGSHTFSPTITQTHTITPTHTASPTITPTATITPTFTDTPTPQPTVYAYPNPAAYRDDMGVAYPIADSKTAERAIVTIHAVNGDFVAQITDDYPNGYTMFDISKLARGIYLYKITVRYADGTEDSHKYRKFSVIK